MKKLIALVLAALLVASLAGCTEGAPVPTDTPAPVDTLAPAQIEAPEETTPPEEVAPNTRTFTDSIGRTVELPAEIEKVAVSGPLAQIVLFALCPDNSLALHLHGIHPQSSILQRSTITFRNLANFMVGKGN